MPERPGETALLPTPPPRSARVRPRPSPARAPDGRLPLVGALAGFGDRTAVVADGVRLTYAELAGRVGDVAARLGAGRRLVMIEGGNDLDTLTTYLGALQGGHVAWLTPPGADADALRERFRPDVLARCGPGATRLVEMSRAAHDLHPDLALLLGTSGSTGAPRLVRLSHGGIQANAEAIAAYLGIGPDERALTPLPIHYCYGLSVVNSHLLRGAGLLLTDRSVADPGFWSLARAEGATSFAGVPHTFELLDRIGFADMDLPALRYLTQAGGRMPPERVRRYARLGAERGWRLVVMYGQTEATARMAYLPPELAATRPESIGRPIPGGAFEVRPVPDTEDPGVGELIYRGPNVMLGYAREPADLAAGRTVHELATGDLARRAGDGLYEIVGRRARFVKPFGLRVDLDEVERICARDGIVARCAGDDRRLTVAVEGAAPPGLAGALAARLRLPAAAVRVLAVAAVPLLPSGKVDYRALVEAADPEMPPGGNASDVAAVFRTVLRRETVADDDTFAGLGGDSLSYVEMSLAPEEVLGRLPEDWPDRTIGELAASGARAGAGARVEMNVALRAGAIALVVASHMTAFWPAGGAHLLLGLAGHSFARLQLAATEGPRRLGRRLASAARIAVPSSAWIGLWWALAGMHGLAAVLLVNNYAGPQTYADGRWRYWFVEALVQILIAAALLFAIPAVRRAERSHAFGFALGALAIALLFRFELVAFGSRDNLLFRPHAIAWIFILGWAAQRARTTADRLLVSAILLAATPGFFGDPVREAVVAGGLLLLIWVPVVVVPRWTSRVLGAVAGASLAIYLTHWQVFPPLRDALPIGLAIPAVIAVGVIAGAALERATARASRALASR
jgi:acyl-CoA synthetase (AMP-forming)/AMP-acid ligase II/peptidoglycan/LPS O-acetylase OafA/YrhL